MSIKNFIIAGSMLLAGAVGSLAIVQPTHATFNPEKECPSTSLYKTQNSKFTKKKPTSLAQCNVLPDEEGKGVMDKVVIIINVVVGVVGIVSVAMIVLGGISYATSQGDAAKAKKAQNTILYSVVGLLISLLAFAIVNFVLTSVFGGSSSSTDDSSSSTDDLAILDQPISLNQ